MAYVDMWTMRTVKFQPSLPVTLDSPEWDALFDNLAGFFYGLPGVIRHFLEPTLVSEGTTIEVSFMPWWMPPSWARRIVVRIASRSGVTGEATYVVSRCVIAR